MPETKQVGFRCHAPSQERREFHSGERLARLPTARPQEERVPVLHGGCHRKPGGHFGAGPDGGGPREEAGARTRTHTSPRGQKWPLLCPAGRPGDNSLHPKACRPAWGSGQGTAARPESGPSRMGLGAGSPGSVSSVPGAEPPCTSPSPPCRAGRAPQRPCIDPDTFGTHVWVPAGPNLHVGRWRGAQARLGDGLCNRHAIHCSSSYHEGT